MIDTHAHLNFPEFKGEISAALSRAKKVGVFKIINIGTDLETSLESVNLARKYPEIFASIGVHPHHAKDFSIESLEKFFVLASKDKVVAIGEIGLDFYPFGKTSRYSSYPSKEEQKMTFIQMLKLAQDCQLPMILHCREAYQDMLSVLRNEGIKGPGVIHCFSGTPKEAKEFLDLGFFISFTGNITYSKERDEVVKEVPLEKILLETDCPYLAPEPYRGKRNEPAYVIEVAKKVAEIKNLALIEIEKITTQNAEKLFAFK
jgi:TatD DNase family protein